MSAAPELLCGHWTFFALADGESVARCDLEAGHDGLHKYWWSPATHESFSWAYRFERHEARSPTPHEGASQ